MKTARTILLVWALALAGTWIVQAARPFKLKRISPDKESIFVFQSRKGSLHLLYGRVHDSHVVFDSGTLFAWQSRTRPREEVWALFQESSEQSGIHPLSGGWRLWLPAYGHFFEVICGNVQFETFTSNVVWIEFDLPYWLVMLLTVALPGVYTVRPAIRWLRGRRYPPGHCRHCGYDLRAHAPGQKCPECGVVIAGATDAVSQRRSTNVG